jgi:hypothetical protein
MPKRTMTKTQRRKMRRAKRLAKVIDAKKINTKQQPQTETK